MNDVGKAFLITGVVLALFLNLVSAELRLTINAKLDGFNADFKAITDSDASTGYDGFDLVALPGTPSGNSSGFYSNVGGNNVSVDVWPSSSNPRTLYLIYYNSPVTSGSLNLSWSFSNSNFIATLKDYGTSSGYSFQVGSSIDMSANSTYKVSSSGIRYFALTIENVAGSGGGGGGGGGSASLNVTIPEECNESKICFDWEVCQNLEASFKQNSISKIDYITFKSECARNGLEELNCGFQIRKCNIVDSCNNILFLPAQSQFCQYVKNPSCSDGVKDCHDGKCEILVDCGGPCKPCPTCSDGIKNQGELGVDCEGPCPEDCPKLSPKDLFSSLFGNKKLRLIFSIVALAIVVAFLMLIFIRLINLIKKNKEKELVWYRL